MAIPNKLVSAPVKLFARNQHLSAQRSQYRTAIKAVRKLVVAGDKAAASEAFVKAQKIIDTMAGKNVFAQERRCSS